MSSAANHKHDHLEEAFRARMYDAEAKPSPDLWTRIDHDLTVQESARYKRSMVWYRQLAAACLVILLAAGSVFFYHISSDKQNTTQPLAVTAPTQKQQESINAPTDSKYNQQPSAQAVTQPAASIAATSEIDKAPKVILQKPEEELILTEMETAPALALGIQEAGIATDLQMGSESIKPVYTSTTKLADPQPGVQTSSRLTKGYFAVAGGSNFNRSATAGPEQQSAFSAYTTARQMLIAMTSSTGMKRYTTAANQLLQNPATNNSELPKPFQQLNNGFINQTASTQTQQEAIKLLALDNDNSKRQPEKEADPAKPGRWTVGMAYVPSYFDQNIGIPEQVASVVPESIVGFSMSATSKSDAVAQSMDDAQDEFEQNTDPAFSFAVEAKAGYRIGKKWKIFSGLGFTQNTARTKSSYIIKQFWLKPSTKEQEQLNTTTVFLPSVGGNVFTDSLSIAKTEDFNVNYRYRHLTIPVGMQFESGISKSWRWYAAGSIAANILLETSVMASNNEVADVHYSRTDHSPFRKMQFSGNVSVGVARRISDNISVSAGPELRGYFDTLLSDSEKALAPQGRPYTVGLNMAVSYDFGGKK